MLAIVGPTAIGKTALSIDIAREFSCEIISVDSMQVYRHMDIGTAKIRPDEMAGIPHHLIDVADPDEEYDAARFVRDATTAIETITGKGKIPLLAGGTGLYLKALTEGLFSGIPEHHDIRNILNERLVSEGVLKLHEELAVCDPESAARIHPHDTSRILRGLEIYLASGIPWSRHLRNQGGSGQGGVVANILQIGLTCDRQALYDRINLRSKLMIEQGLEDEVRRLLAMGYREHLKSLNSIGYRHMLKYIDNSWSLSEMLELLSRDTRRYAKRQYTWFKGIRDIEWFTAADGNTIKARIGQWLSDR